MSSPRTIDTPQMPVFTAKAPEKVAHLLRWGIGVAMAKRRENKYSNRLVQDNCWLNRFRLTLTSNAAARRRGSRIPIGSSSAALWGCGFSLSLLSFLQLIVELLVKRLKETELTLNEFSCSAVVVMTFVRDRGRKIVPEEDIVAESGRVPVWEENKLLEFVSTDDAEVDGGGAVVAVRSLASETDCAMVKENVALSDCVGPRETEPV